MTLLEKYTDASFIIDYELKKIEALFREECRRAVHQYKGNYSCMAGMGVFGVSIGDVPLTRKEMPARFKKLEMFWDMVIDDYNYYMTTEEIKKELV